MPKKDSCTAKTNAIMAQTQNLLRSMKAKMAKPPVRQPRKRAPIRNQVKRTRVFNNTNRRQPTYKSTRATGSVTGGPSQLVPVNSGNTLMTGQGPIDMMANSMASLSMSSSYKSKFANPRGDMRYIHCRLNPFSTEGSLGIPDGSSIRKFVVDYRCYSDISITSAQGPFSIMFTPTLPSFAYFKGTTVGGMSFTSPFGAPYTVGNAQLTYADNWFPFMYPQELAATCGVNPVSATPGTFKTVPAVYQQTKSRIITIAHKIYYTGTASLCSGTITVSQAPFEVADGELTLNTNTQTINTNISTGGGPTAAVSTINTIPARLSFSSNTLSKNTVSNRVELGAYIMLQHAGGSEPSTYRWIPHYDAPVYFINSATNLNILAASASTGNIQPDNYGGASLFDFDWTPVIAQFTGGVAGHSYRIESVFCVEYQLGQNSPYERAAVSAPRDVVAIKAATMASNTMPVAIPIASDPMSWVDTAISIASKVGSAVMPFVKMLL